MQTKDDIYTPKFELNSKSPGFSKSPERFTRGH